MKTLLILGLTGILACSNPISYEEKQNTKWRTQKNVDAIYYKMLNEAMRLKTLDDVVTLQSKFKYEGREKDWESDIETLFYNDFVGDCSEAALLGIWGLSHIDIFAREVILYSSKKDIYHAICMSNDNHIFITNNHVCKIEGNRWKEAVLTYPLFKGDYDKIIK